METSVTIIFRPVTQDSLPETEQSFEKALARLEEIVRELESGTGNLEASLGCYEEGVKLARYCLERLSAAELRIQELKLEP